LRIRQFFYKNNFIRTWRSFFLKI